MRAAGWGLVEEWEAPKNWKKGGGMLGREGL